MNPTIGGQTPEDRQRQTAAEIARKKVLAAYFGGAERENTENARAIPVTQVSSPQTASLKQSPVSAPSQAQQGPDWQKYHSAWQNYYQKYYSEYYAKAAHQYVETEKMKAERERHDSEEVTNQASAEPISENTVETEKGLGDYFKEKIQKTAGKQKKHSKLRRQLTPIIAGAVAVLFVLFLQYNRMIFAPIFAYVSPGNSTDTGITEIDPTVATAVSADNRLIIPKLNVDVPIIFNVANDTDSMNIAMTSGVAQFAVPGASALPGENGNFAISGHSAGDIYSSNPYKFIFSGLERLTNGDLIYVDYGGIRYTYSVTLIRTVEPSDVASLNLGTEKPYITLITCTPIGTTRYRLLVTGEQVNPVPTGTVQQSAESNSETTEVLPENDATFFEGIWNFVTGN